MALMGNAGIVMADGVWRGGSGRDKVRPVTAGLDMADKDRMVRCVGA
jgi:hypothetical protein